MATPDTRAQLKRISALIRNNEMAQAIALLKPILVSDPRNPEAWWLAANAAPTPEASMQACERLLAVQPDYEPARHMLTGIKLKQAAALVKQAQSSEALLLLRPIVAEQPNNVEALWLMARSVPVGKEAIEICLRILTLQPDHEGAKRLIATKQQTLAAAEARRQTQHVKRRSPSWLVFGLIGILVLAGAGLLIVLYISGVGVPKNVTHNLGAIGSSDIGSSSGGAESPLLGSFDTQGFHIYSDSLPPDGQHDYTFTASANSLLLAMVIFPTSNGNPNKALILLGPNGKQIAVGADQSFGSRKGMAMIQAELPSDGTYILRLKGIPGVAQGAYSLEMGVQEGFGMQ